MRERERPTDERPYWQRTHALGRFDVAGDQRPLYLRLHRSTERIVKHDELVPLTVTTGERTYFHAKPYRIVPDITLQVDLSPSPRADNAIGFVRGEERDVRTEEVGQAQAWYYRADRLLVIWECFFEERYGLAGQQAEGNANLHKLWDGFESVLLDQLPAAERIVTTWEGDYERPDWQRFMGELGYSQTAPAVFEKAAR